MADAPRIFVGTMASGEAEFDECCAAVWDQQDVEVEHQVVRDLPEAEAHAALWDAWARVKHRHNLFVKVDADTILADRWVLRKVWELFAGNPRVTGAQVLLHDYFTDRLIAGLNFFSPAVVFKKPKSRLLCDRVDMNHDIVLRGEEVAHLAPIGYHCKYPSPRQAFHYGLHRTFKKQSQVIADVAEAWRRDTDEGREWALAGAMSASFWLNRRYDYGNRRFDEAFEAVKADRNRLKKIEIFVEKIIAASRRPSS